MRTDALQPTQAGKALALNLPPPRVDIIIMDRRCCPPQATLSPMCWAPALMMVVETAAAAADEDDVGTPDARATVAARPAWQTSRFSIVPSVCLCGGAG